MDSTPHWRDLLKHPAEGDHVVQTYQDAAFLVEALAEYTAAGLQLGDAVVAFVTAKNWKAVARLLEARGFALEEAMKRGQLRVLDAEQAVARVLRAGMPDWNAFQDVVGPVLAEARLQYAGVRVLGDMVDLLWQKAEHEAATRLEGYLNDMARAHGFSLLCAYHLDALDADSYGGSLQCVCEAHTHLIPARDYARFNHAVSEASKEVLDQPLAQMLLSLASTHRPSTQMPPGQAILLWLRNNMPRAASRVLALARLRYDLN